MVTIKAYGDFLAEKGLFCIVRLLFTFHFTLSTNFMSSTLTKLTHKQLFLTDCKIKGEEILIDNKDLLSQVRKVLRLQKGDTFYVQNNGTRYEVEIKDWNDTTLTGTIKKEINTPTLNPWSIRWMVIGMPNKWEKVELVVQKLTEIWLDEIIFWPSERSVIKTWNTNKEERLMKIAREAVEQSWGRKLPTITFTSNIKEKLQKCDVVVFDKTDNEKRTMDNSIQHSPITITQPFGLVGPEWWLTDRDYEHLKWIKYEIRELGTTMLRTETAAIIGWWLIKNTV